MELESRSLRRCGRSCGGTILYLLSDLEELNEELEVLNSEAGELEERIANNVAKLLEEAT